MVALRSYELCWPWFRARIYTFVSSDQCLKPCFPITPLYEALIIRFLGILLSRAVARLFLAEISSDGMRRHFCVLAGTPFMIAFAQAPLPYGHRDYNMPYASADNPRAKAL